MQTLAMLRGRCSYMKWENRLREAWRRVILTTLEFSRILQEQEGREGKEVIVLIEEIAC